MFLTCPLPTQYLLLFVPSHTKKEKKTTGFSPPSYYCTSGFNLLKSAPSLNNFYAHFFDQAIWWPPVQTIQQTQIYKGCYHSTLSLLVFIWVWSEMCKIYKGCYAPPCLYWFWFGFEVKWVKGQGRVCKFVMACHDKNVIHDSMIWEREKKKTSENKVIWWCDKVGWFSSTGYLHRRAHREAYQPVKVFSLGLAAAGRKIGDLGLNEPIITIPLLFSQTYIFPFCCILVFLIQSHKS
jgi:hypothetical protein